jgi:hypothetical protein
MDFRFIRHKSPSINLKIFVKFILANGQKKSKLNNNNLRNSNQGEKDLCRWWYRLFSPYGGNTMIKSIEYLSSAVADMTVIASKETNYQIFDLKDPLVSVHPVARKTEGPVFRLGLSRT